MDRRVKARRRRELARLIAERKATPAEQGEFLGLKTEFEQEDRERSRLLAEYAREHGTTLQKLVLSLPPLAFRVMELMPPADAVLLVRQADARKIEVARARLRTLTGSRLFEQAEQEVQRRFEASQEQAVVTTAPAMTLEEAYVQVGHDVASGVLQLHPAEEG
jgi:hypothetical protein